MTRSLSKLKMHLKDAEKSTKTDTIWREKSILWLWTTTLCERCQRVEVMSGNYRVEWRRCRLTITGCLHWRKATMKRRLKVGTLSSWPHVQQVLLALYKALIRCTQRQS